jgi:drug/metabolite transporter (DMT)-like permease
MSIFFGSLGFLILAVVFIFDKYILSEEKLPAIVFAFVTCIFTAVVFLLVPFGVSSLSGLDWLIALFAGMTFGLALWTSFTAIEKTEVSHIGPLQGAMIPLIVVFLSRTFLTELITAQQLIAIFILAAGSLLISFEKSKKHSGWHLGFVWGLAASLFFAASHVSSKYIYDIYGFYSGLVWTRGAIGLFGVTLFLSPIVRKYILSSRQKKKLKKKVKKTHEITLVVVSRVLAVVAVLLIQYATAIGKVSIVNALHGVQFGGLVLLVALLSKFYPKLFKEYYAKGELKLELVAVVIITFGLVLLLS